MLYIGMQADSERTQDAQVYLGSAQAQLRFYSGFAPACSPLAQVKAGAAHVRRLKRNQRKRKINPESRCFRLH